MKPTGAKIERAKDILEHEESLRGEGGKPYTSTAELFGELFPQKVQR